MAATADRPAVGSGRAGARSAIGPSAGLAAVVFASSLTVYWRTAHPTVHTTDVGEYAAAAASLGIVHSPGYPTYLLLARLALILPHGDAARLLNLASGLAAALTAAGLALLIARLTGSRLAGLSAALFFAFTHYQWTEAIIATPYTLNALWLVADLWLIQAWRAGRRMRPLLGFALLYGLQPGLHMSAILQAPGFALQLLGTDARWFRAPRRLLVLAGLGLLGLSVWLYLPLRAAADPPIQFARDVGLDLTRPDDLWLFVTSEPFRDDMFRYGPARLLGEIQRVAAWHTRNFLGIGLPLGALGLVVQARRDRLLASSLLIGCLLHVAFYVNFAAPNKDTMFLPGYLIWAIWLGEGLAWLVRRVPRERARPLALLVAALPLLPLLTNYERIDASRNRVARELAEAALRTVEPDGLLIGQWLEVTPARYLAVVEGIRPDVELLNLGVAGLKRRRELARAGRAGADPTPSVAADTVRLVRERLQAGQSVYLFQALDAEPIGWRYVEAGPVKRAVLAP